MQDKFKVLQAQLQGELYTSEAHRRIYATDASVYRDMPLAVTLPKNDEDVQKIIQFADKNGLSIIPRTAGTSLAGQVIGKGIVVDVSKYFTQILEVNQSERWVRLQPGIIRNDLNAYLKDFGLFFAPETATQNRAMIGGMVGNNSCGSNSIIYGSTREHILEIKGFLSNGQKIHIKAQKENQNQDDERNSQETPKNIDLERINVEIHKILSDPSNQHEIKEHFPKKDIPRRNTGYALDILLHAKPYNIDGEDFNLSKLICGSEGTLLFITELKLNLLPLPSQNKLLVCVHCNSVDEALKANLVAIRYNPSASELIDHYILECTKTNIEQQKNRFFVKGDPKAILAVELYGDTMEDAYLLAEKMEAEMLQEGFGHHFPSLKGEDIAKVWALRNAGLGLLSNLEGDAKPVCFVEDTAVSVEDLPEYIKEFNIILAKYGLYSVHYAHAGTGELHLRPILNLKLQKDRVLFRKVAQETAELVKKYKGSLSGEHGDGRLRGEFIPLMVGEKNYQLFKEIKKIFDPKNIFNPNKIVDTPPLDVDFRYENNQQTPQISTYFSFEKQKSILHLAEKCNGSGDCRKTEITGGTMCPSFMATRNEIDTTRARANILREFLTRSEKKNRFDHQEIKEVMDLCLSCKGCKSECPSNVDVGKMKAEFSQHYYDANGVPFRTKLIANFTNANHLASKIPKIYNFFVSNAFTSSVFKKVAGFAPKRSIPLLENQTLYAWYKKNYQPPTKIIKTLYLFCDEFTNFNDVTIGIKTVQLLVGLGYEVKMIESEESGRTHLSKGLLKNATKIANKNVAIFKDLISKDVPLVGVEPSAILTFRDEYLDLVSPNLINDAQNLAANSFLLDEFLANEIDKGNIKKEQFTTEARLLKLHGHCHQKALSSLSFTKKVLETPANYQMHLIRSGCCGMAGSFGYETEHYEVSMKIGELVLFPEVRKQPDEVIVVASGTSCRHQIKDGTSKKALHLAEVLWEALLK